MSARRDAALALCVLGVAAGSVLAVGIVPSLGWAIAGGLATLGFELVASRDPDAIRRRWERPVVQAGSLGLALVVVGLGAWLAPVTVLSGVVGALLTYLGVLSVATMR